MIYLMIWLLCGVVVSLIYSGKGRSGVTGFLAGAVLGPVGVILALLTSDATEVK